jgi:hypothetical protein
MKPLLSLRYLLLLSLYCSFPTSFFSTGNIASPRSNAEWASMESALQETILEAAGQLSQILDQGASLFLQTLTCPSAPLLKAALGFSQQQPQESEAPLITCLFDPSTLSRGSKESVDFPVLVEKRVLGAVKAYYTVAFRTSLTCSKPLDEHQADDRHSLTDSLDNSPHVTRTIISDKSAAFIALSWLCNPQFDGFIISRRRWLRASIRVSETQSLTASKLRLFVKEVVLLELMLSVAPKLKSLWEYRLWILTQILHSDLFSSLSTSSNSLESLLVRLQRQDDASFFAAAHNHPMNYNAWHYRRCLKKLLTPFIVRATLSFPAIERSAHYDCQCVIKFIREHNGDSSATSYLLFLLRELETKTHARPIEKLENTLQSPSNSEEGRLVSGKTVGEETTMYSASALWKLLMVLTQEEIRRHFEKGHESMWYLRLELIRWALSKRSRLNLWSSWTVKDELGWISVYVDATSILEHAQLLSPVSAMPHAWAESFGSLAWTSYNAARYGVEFLSILGCFYPLAGANAKSA